MIVLRLILMLMLVATDETVTPPVTPPADTKLDPVASIEITDALGNQVIGDTQIGQLLRLSAAQAVHAKVDGSLTWLVETDSGQKLQSVTLPSGDVIVNTGLKPDVLRVMQIVSHLSGKNAYQRMSVRIGTAPNPPPDDDRDDDPTPKPDPDPAPKTDKLKVLIVEETAARNLLPESQRSILFGAKIRDYLTSHTTRGPDGQPDFRIYDKDVSVAKEPEWLKAAFGEKRATLPWIVLSNGREGFSGPLPSNVDDCLKLLQRYGGE